MVRGLVKSRNVLLTLADRIRRDKPNNLTVAHQGICVALRAIAWAFFIVLAFIVEIPLHWLKTPMESFQLVARRGPGSQFLDSYTVHMRRNRAAVATTLTTLLLLAVQTYLFGLTLIQFGTPHKAEAYTSTTTIEPSWDQSTIRVHNCTTLVNSYSCDSATAATLNMSYIDDCADTGNLTERRSELNYSIPNLPVGSTVSKVEFIFTVSATGPDNYVVGRSSTDSTSAPSCITSAMWTQAAGGTAYATGAYFSTTGVKTVDLGATAASNVQARQGLAFTLGIYNSSNSGVDAVAMYSVNNATDHPQLKIYYTLPPQAPTSTSHSSITDSTVTWTWTDNATAETRYDVEDAGHTPVTGCTNLAANTQSCTETGLSVNTQYTRHPMVTDANGTTDGASASAYTSIEASTGVTIGPATSTSIDVTSTNTPSNLGTGSAALQFAETVTSTTSAWQGNNNAWTKTGLTPNTQYSFKAQSRNGDGATTTQSGATAKYTLSTTANVSGARTASTWYKTSGFDFTNADAWGAGGVQYYRYVWNQVATHTFTGSESTWSDANAKCPTGTCTAAGATLSNTATSDGNWYLHVIPYNAEGAANGSGTNYGPYQFDGTNPVAPTTVNDGTGSDATYQTSITQLAANWTAATDATSGVAEYFYAIGTTSGGTDTVNWTSVGTDISVTKTGLTLTNGTKYYVSVKANDAAGNTSAVATSDGITVNTSLPIITDNQTGDATPRDTSGTSYNVDFAKAPTGPSLDFGQYTVYSGPGKTGTKQKDWTTIFNGPAVTYTTGWSVDFSALREGTNYVSVRVYGLDGLSNELVDAFTVVKDTVAPTISDTKSTPTTTTTVITWTTNEPATSQVQWGTSSSYGNLTTADASLVTSHSVSISNLAAGTAYHAQAISVDEAGNSSASTDLSFTTTAADVLPTLPTTTTTPTLNPNSTVKVAAPTLQKPVLSKKPNAPFTVTGVGKGGQIIEVYVDNKLIKKTTLSGTSTKTQSFSAVVDIKKLKLKPGKHTVTARAKNKAGQASSMTRAITFTLKNNKVKLSTAATYTVQGGDSLWEISQNFLGDGAAYSRLVSANVSTHPSLAVQPSVIRPGWVLLVPAH